GDRVPAVRWRPRRDPRRPGRVSEEAGQAQLPATPQWLCARRIAPAEQARALPWLAGVRMSSGACAMKGAKARRWWGTVALLLACRGEPLVDTTQSGSGGAGPSMSCPGDQIACGSSCVDLQ